jgi:toxin ParE1/3/4
VKPLVLADTARSDLQSIAEYSQRVWGSDAKRRYMQALEAILLRIAERPSAGLPRNEISLGYRSLRGGRHLVFYRERTEVVEVIRVLHESMDFRLHLPSTGRRSKPRRS